MAVKYKTESFKCPKCESDMFMLFAAKRTGKIMRVVCVNCFAENVLIGERKIQPMNKGGVEDGADNAGH